MTDETAKQFHSIAGYFAQQMVELGNTYAFVDIYPFSGYFFRDPTTKKLEGRLVDEFGASTIEGTMDDKKLRFQKSYLDRAGVPIDYEFERAENSWRGYYHGRGLTITEDEKPIAECWTHLILEDTRKIPYFEEVVVNQKSS